MATSNMTAEEHIELFTGAVFANERDLLDAFTAGFLASGEGFNGEYCRRNAPRARMVDADWRDHVAREIRQPFLLWLANRRRES